MKRLGLVAAALAGIVIAWLAVRSGDPAGPASTRGTGTTGNARATSGVTEPARAPRVRAGQRTPTGDAPRRDLAELRASAREIADPSPSFVPPERMADQAKANAQSIRVARETGEHPERLDPSIVPAPFGRETWVKDTQQYLGVVEPGRVWQASTAPGVDPLQPSGTTELSLPAQGRARLEVICVSGAPVTFTSFDGGALDNGLASITVPCDSDGRAGTGFQATPDTAATVTVLAASPYSTGVVQFTLQLGSP